MRYDELMSLASEKLARIERLYQDSKLPEVPDRDLIVRLLVAVRAGFYDGL